MRTAARLGGFAAMLAVVFGAAWGVGAATATPATRPSAEVGGDISGDMGGDMGGMHARVDVGSTAPATVDLTTGGLAATAGGYTLVPQVTTFLPGQPGRLTFAVAGLDGSPVTAFDPARMRLSVVRRDTAGFERPAAVLGAGGVWRAPLTLPAPGVYRLYADFTPADGHRLVLGTDLFVPGDFVPDTFEPTRVAQVDGYQVRIDGDLVTGRSSQVFATVTRDGRAVTDLEPVDGSFGDLTVLRRSDLAQIPVDAGESPAPAPDDRSGPGIAFTTSVPTPGGYRVFLTFRHAGAPHIAAFTLTTREGS
jgi:hypothetical protein